MNTRPYETSVIISLRLNTHVRKQMFHLKDMSRGLNNSLIELQRLIITIFYTTYHQTWVAL